MKSYLKKLLCAIWTMLIGAVVILSCLPIPTAAETTVYSTQSTLFAAIRSVLKNHQSGDFEFEVTDELLAQFYDEIYHQPRFSIYDIFNFNSDQSDLPADEGDYLLHSFVGGTFGGFMGNSLKISINPTYFTTLDQEASFENKLNTLFSSGGALANVKSLSKVEQVVACMDYIKANVTWQGGSVQHSAYSALCNGGATCEGMALLLNRMLRCVGIPNRILMGEDSGAHTYNIVLLDGKYYYCDPSAYVVLKGSNSFSTASLQYYYQDSEFENNVLSKISTTDYPLPSANVGNTSNNTEIAGGTQSSGTASAENSNDSKTPTSSKADGTTTAVVQYKILDGADSTYEVGTTEFSLRADGEFKKFVSIEVGGKVVDSKYYTVKEGSTIVTFTKEFMDSLAAGVYAVKFNFTDGVACTNITVAAKNEDETESNANKDNLTDETSSEELYLYSDKKLGGAVLKWIFISAGIALVTAALATAIIYLYKKR